MDKNFITSVQKSVTDFRPDGTLYQLVEQQSIAALNSGDIAECKPLPPAELGELLRVTIKKLYGLRVTKPAHLIIADI